MRKPRSKLIHQQGLSCDRCARQIDRDADVHDWQEATTIRFRANAHGPFIEGKWHTIDLCQHCLKATLGKHLRVVDDDPFERRRQPSASPINTYTQQEIDDRLEGTWLAEQLIATSRQHELVQREENAAMRAE